MHQRLALSGCAFVLLLSACNIDAPFDPARIFQPIDQALEQIENAIDNALADPLGSKPYPALIGGDSERVFYAANLGDIQINFPGPTNDLVVPGVLGPSNLYEFTRRKPDLIRPLVPAGAATGVVTDGVHLAYVALTDLDAPGEFPLPVPNTLIVATVGGLDDRVVFDGPAGGSTELVAPGSLALDAGRLAFVIVAADFSSSRIRIVDLVGDDATRDIEADAFRNSIRLRGNLLVYGDSSQEEGDRIVLRDLNEPEETIIARNLRTDGNLQVYLASNAVVWSEDVGDGISRVMSYSITSGETRLWADAVRGTLTGASDAHFITEELVDNFPDAPNRVIIRRFDQDAKEKKLAEFRQDGLAGQSRIIGDRAAWVNPDREIVLAPLAGGDRTIFKPY